MGHRSQQAGYDVQVSGIGGAALGGAGAVGATGPASASAPAAASVANTSPPNAGTTPASNAATEPRSLPSDTSVAERLLANSNAVAESMAEFYEGFDLTKLLVTLLLLGGTGKSKEDDESSGAGALLGLLLGMSLANQLGGSMDAGSNGVAGVESTGPATGGMIDVYA